jgi:flagellar basal body-associated protein FliL
MMREERAPKAATTCPACNSPVNAGDRFCEKCGEKIPPPSALVQAPVCRSCGTSLLPNARFCENCGDPVKKAEVSAAPSPLASARPVSQEPVLPRGLIVTEEPVAVAGPGIPEESGPVHAPTVPAADGAEPLLDEGIGPEPIHETESWEEPEDEFAEEPVQEPEPESEEGFEEEPPGPPEEEFTEEPEESLQGETAEELPDEPEEEPGYMIEEPGPAANLPKSRAGPVDELLLGLEPEEPTGPGPGKRPAGAATTIPKKPAAATAAAPRKPGSSKKTLLVIALIAAVILIAIAIVALLPVLIGPGVSGTTVPSVQATPVATAIPVVTPEPTSPPAPVVTETSVPVPSAPAATPAATETPEQIDVLPPQYTLHFEVFKDVVTGDVTVIVTGSSRNVVKDIEVTVFHPDGTTDSDHLLPSQGMTEVTVTGTRSAERVVATVLFYSGEQYKLIDRTVSFSRRT